jgi:Calcineurin-like phosphoesterase
VNRLDFGRRSRLLGVLAALAVIVATIPGAVAKPLPVVPIDQAWSFGVMDDTQWTTTDPASANRNAVAISIINQINPQFVKAGVKFVVQVGDLTENGNDADIAARAAAAQPLYDAGIGFFPMRGNHETYGTANSFGIPAFQANFPQTRGLSQTFGATSFSSPTSVSPDLNGTSYSFDYGATGSSARFVIVDPWVTPSRNVAPGNGYNYGYSIADQQAWISSRLDQQTRGTTQAFVFSHQPLIAENHQDSPFVGQTYANPAMQNAFLASLQASGVKYYISGHDHINQRSIITSPDGASKVQEIIGASDSRRLLRLAAALAFVVAVWVRLPTRLFYRDGRPTRIGGLVNHAGAVYSADGLPPAWWVTLEIRGRRSGRTVSTTLVVGSYGGEPYLVSMLGDGSRPSRC